jgi:hypothetical protein
MPFSVPPKPAHDPPLPGAALSFFAVAARVFLDVQCFPIENALRKRRARSFAGDKRFGKGCFSVSYENSGFEAGNDAPANDAQILCTINGSPSF